MTRVSRVKKSLLNVKVNFICYFVSLFVSFITRKILLEKLGTDFIGLSTTLQSILGFLNLAELGVGGAISYVLYRPIFEENKSKINEIISVLGYLYRILGFIILGGGFLISMFIPLIFYGSGFELWLIFMGFYAYLFSSLLGYFANYKQTLLSADQREYEITGYFQAVTTTKVISQMLFAIYSSSIVLYFIIEIVFGIMYSIILNYRIKKVYPWLKSEVRLGKNLFKKYPEIATYIKQLFVQKISFFMQFQISPLLIYSFVSLPIVALYGNYTILSSKLQALAITVLNSASSGIGNLISERDSTKTYNVYSELFSLRFYFASLISIYIYFLLSPLITVWLGSEYLLPNVILLLAIGVFLVLLRGCTDSFLNGFGLFYDVWAPIVESLLIIIFSIVGGFMFKLEGILLGPIIATIIIIHIWKPYFLFNKGFKMPVIKYWGMFIKHFILFFSVSIASYIVYRNYNIFSLLASSWHTLIIGSMIIALIESTLLLCLFYMFSSGFRRFVGRFIKLDFLNKFTI